MKYDHVFPKGVYMKGFLMHIHIHTHERMNEGC